MQLEAINCTWVNNGTHLVVTNDTDETGEIIFDNEHKITFPPHSRVKLCALVFGRQVLPIGQELHGDTIDFSNEIWDGKINGEVFWNNVIEEFGQERHGNTDIYEEQLHSVTINGEVHKMKHKELKYLKAGDLVYHVRHGWKDIEPAAIPAIVVCGCAYTEDGRFSKEDVNPTIYTYNPFDPEDMPPVEFKVGEVIAVRNGLTGRWEFDKYESTTKGAELPTTCDHYSYRYARKLTDVERGE